MEEEEMRVPYPIIEEIVEEPVQAPFQEPRQEPNVAEAVEVENPEPPREYMDGIIIGPKDVEDNFDEGGMEQSTILDWLREIMKAKVPEKVHQVDNTTALLAELDKSNKVKPPKPAKRFPLIQRDSVGCRTVQVVVPKAELRMISPLRNMRLLL